MFSGSGRNIRHLPCVSRRTGEQGTCMFAYTCMKANGTHLGTCIDRFYFGSCCKLEGDHDPFLENDISYPQLSNNKVTESERPSISTVIDAVKQGADVSTTEKVFVPISKPNKTEEKPTTPRPLTTTLPYKLSTFQVVHDNSPPTTPTPTTQKTTTTLAEKRTTTELPKTTSRPKPVTTTKQEPTKATTTTKKPTTKKPIAKPTTAKPVTKKPVTSTTTKKPTPIKVVTTTTTTTKKPVSSTTVYNPVSTVTKPQVTKKPIVTKTTTSTTTPISILSTTSEVVFTKPGLVLPTNFTTSRPDLNPTTGSSILSVLGLTTFSYVDKTSTTIEVTTSKISSSSEESSQENVVLQISGSTASSTSQESSSTSTVSQSTTTSPTTGKE